MEMVHRLSHLWAQGCSLFLLFCWLFSCSVRSNSLESPWTIARQTPLSMRFSRPEYLNGLAFPSPGNLPDPGIKPMSPALAGGFFTTELPGKPHYSFTILFNVYEIYKDDPLPFLILVICVLSLFSQPGCRLIDFINALLLDAGTLRITMSPFRTDPFIIM